MTETTSPPARRAHINKPLFAITGGFITLFCITALLDLTLLSGIVDVTFGFAARYFGLYWQILLLATFLIGLVLIFLPGSRVLMGGVMTPEFPGFQWGAMIMCTLLVGGGVFWAAGEPMAHFLSSPPYFGGAGGTPADVAPALAQSFMHWGFLAWAILGALSTIMLMHYHYEKGLPMAPRTLLYPVFGDRAITGPIGWIADASCIIAVVAGTVGPVGFLGLQVSYGLEALFGIPDTFATQATVIAGLVALYTISAITGLSKGIQILSRINVILAAALLIFMLIAGPTAFILKSYVAGFSSYITNFFGMALHRGDAAVFGAPGWQRWWTVFFWGWFMGYGPLMAMFIARVSRGRSIRSIIIMLAIIAPVVTTFWFTIVGGSGIAFELQNPGSVSEPFEGLNLPAALLAITQQLPLGFMVSLLFLVLTTIFVATTGDSMTYVISVTMSNEDRSVTSVRVFWGVAMGAMALVLIWAGAGGIGKLQSFIVVTAVPVSLILLPSLWDALRITIGKGRGTL